MAEAPQGAGPDVGEIIVSTDKNLAMLAEMAQGGGMPPELAEGFAAVSAQFRRLVDQALSATEGGAPEPAAPGGAEGIAAQEAGGNPRARPMTMGG